MSCTHLHSITLTLKHEHKLIMKNITSTTSVFLIEKKFCEIELNSSVSYHCTQEQQSPLVNDCQVGATKGIVKRVTFKALRHLVTHLTPREGVHVTRCHIVHKHLGRFHDSRVPGHRYEYIHSQIYGYEVRHTVVCAKHRAQDTFACLQHSKHRQ